MARFRLPSISTALGITRAKKQLNRELGVTAVERPFRAYGNAKRRALRRSGYYSTPMKWARFIGRIVR